MSSQTNKYKLEKKLKKWSSLITEKERKTIIRRKKDSKTTIKRLEKDIIVVPKGIDLIYPDILINIMKYLSEDDYLNFISHNDKLSEYSVRNSVYQQYLMKYHKEEYDDIVDNLELYKNKILDLDPKYTYYDIHYDMYPEHFEEEIPNVYGLSEKEVKIYRKEVRQKELYDKWKDIIELNY